MISLPSKSEQTKLLQFLKTVHLKNLTPDHNLDYCEGSYRRFLYTLDLAKNLKGKCLELGSNPYFTTVLLKQFTELEMICANYFGEHFESKAVEEIQYLEYYHQKTVNDAIDFYHFNIELEAFPFSSSSLDVVLFCEIIEHLLTSPLHTVQEIYRVLKPGGHLILTTPNVLRLENKIKMALNRNIYDAYSPHGAYGRHNREYTVSEVKTLLEYCGFTVDYIATRDVHDNGVTKYLKPLKLLPNTGQYIFIKATRAANIAKNSERPIFLPIT